MLTKNTLYTYQHNFNEGISKKKQTDSTSYINAQQNCHIGFKWHYFSDIKINIRKKFNLLLSCTVFFLSLKTYAENVVRDSEMENIILEAVSPIIKVSGVSGKINFFFIQNPQINAFTPGGNDI